ncbi:helix-turn-helix domain-containing protein [Marinospirillum minutulum]|uniref:helix-turn-helix domain-containing protein n=1 Tax=Marinospirillum minutulum TaxID=64974 RepID=UPI0004047CBF|nr:helix-turn-helix transcriptional regulator [Marinospirillum minutulum]
MNSRFSKLLEQAKNGNDYWVAKISQDFTEEVSQIMQQKHITKKDLADKLETSPAYITKVMRGNTNFTVESMVKIANSLDMQLHVHLAPKDSDVRWFDVYENQTNSPDYNPSCYTKIDEQTNELTACAI